MPARIHLNANDPRRLTSRLRELFHVPNITIEGPDPEAEHVVAIVGTRKADPYFVEGARWLAGECARRGIVVASGGAMGIDRAAHEGALGAGGTTWVVLGTGCERTFPREHGPFYESVADRGGTLIWPFAPDYATRYGFRIRNEYLVAISDVIVAVQAPHQSGTRNTCGRARDVGKSIWVIPPPPWLKAPGNLEEVELGARFLFALNQLLEDLGLEPDVDDSGPSSSADRAARHPQELPKRADPQEQLLLDQLLEGPQHPDDLVRRSGLASSVVSRALLTLSLDSVVVDGPDGRYRRCR